MSKLALFGGNKHISKPLKLYRTIGVEEEKIVQESSSSDENENKRVIVDMSKLTNIIHDKMDQKKKEDIEADQKAKENKKED